jgi:hypothetical protein
MSTVEPEDVSWLWFGRLPLGKVVVLDGDPAVGKSTMTTDLAARVSTGKPMPDELEAATAGTVVIMSAEDGLADTIRPRLDAAGADVTRIHAVTGVTEVDEDGVVSERPPSIPGDIGLLEALVRRTGAVLVVVDVLMAYLAGTTNSYRDQDVRLALTPLAMMAERCGCCVLVLRHVRKASTGNAIYAGGGSIGIIGQARVGLIAAYDPDDDNPDENLRRRVLAVVKCNIAPKAASLGYSIVSAGAVGCIDWHGPVAHRADDLVDHDGRDDERSDKEDFLRDLLADGPVPAKDVEKAARADGWTIKQLRPVLKRLGGRTVKEGFDGGWTWTMHPEDAHEDAQDAHIRTRAPSAPSGHLGDDDDATGDRTDATDAHIRTQATVESVRATVDDDDVPADLLELLAAELGATAVTDPNEHL